MNLHTTDLPLTINREFYNDLVDNFTQIDALEGQVGALEDQVGALKDRVKQLQENDKDHEKRLKRIEELLFGSQSINATTISADDESDHQGYEIADIPPYDYAEQEIN